MGYWEEETERSGEKVGWVMWWCTDMVKGVMGSMYIIGLGRKGGVDISPHASMDGLCIAWELRKCFEYAVILETLCTQHMNHTCCQ